MRIQLLSDLHLESEPAEIEPAEGAELLVLAGDIDSRWEGLARFAGWPVPVLFVAGNHEYDGRDIDAATAALRRRCAELGLTMLDRDATVRRGRAGERIRFLGCTRWSDYDVFGAAGRAKAMRAGAYFMKLAGATRAGAPFGVEAVRAEALASRAWLKGQLARPAAGWDRTVVVTHFAPSLRSADPRFGERSGTASFCNGDEALLAAADAWLHGHVHWPADYRLERPGGFCRVVCNSHGHARRGETAAHRPRLLIDV